MPKRSQLTVNQSPKKWDRTLLQVKGELPGPVFLLTAGIHGNEPASFAAVSNIKRKLREFKIPVAGEILAFAGHERAREADVRFFDRDLNRLWTKDRTDVLEECGVIDTGIVEDLEQCEVFKLIDAACSNASSSVYALDLHTTSSDGAPFAVFAGDTPSLDFVQKLGAPIVGNSEDELEGLLITYLARRGCIAAVIEGGWHLSPLAVECLEAMTWISLVEAGNIRSEDIPEFESYKEVLRQQGKGVPNELEIVYHHWIEPEDEFVMRPGFRNFQFVNKGEFLGRDRSGPVFAAEESYIFMPLYQSAGNQGFLLTKPKS